MNIKLDKPGELRSAGGTPAVRLLGDDLPLVSRGGIKLAGALDHWHIGCQ